MQLVTYVFKLNNTKNSIFVSDKLKQMIILKLFNSLL